MTLGPTFVNFTYCEFEGRWQKISEVSQNVETYEAMEDNAKINTRTFSEKKTEYYMKKGAKVTINNHVLKFDKAELA
ncbi:MAG: hypothetical protein K5777_01810 [Nitrosopumilus sp.]|nr:hypothetical protein [Nitrosopumilus sp.]